MGNPQMAKLKNVVCLMPIILIPITASFHAVSSLHTITWSAVPYKCYTHNMQCKGGREKGREEGGGGGREAMLL